MHRWKFTAQLNPPSPMLFDLAHLPYWIVLGMGILLFLIVILGGAADGEIDLEVDADVDVDIDGLADFSSMQLLGWLGLGNVPLVLLLATDLSLVGLLGWMFNVIVAELTGRLPSQGWSAIVLCISAIILGLGLGAMISRPLGQMFSAFGEDTCGHRLVGRLGTVTSAYIPKEKIGQVDVLDADGNRVTISATLPEWATIIPQRGEEVLVIDRQPQAYFVVSKESPDANQWTSN